LPSLLLLLLLLLLLRVVLLCVMCIKDCLATGEAAPRPGLFSAHTFYKDTPPGGLINRNFREVLYDASYPRRTHNGTAQRRWASLLIEQRYYLL